jgi:hypothetical protein
MSQCREMNEFVNEFDIDTPEINFEEQNMKNCKPYF